MLVNKKQSKDLSIIPHKAHSQTMRIPTFQWKQVCFVSVKAQRPIDHVIPSRDKVMLGHGGQPVGGGGGGGHA